jgi:hypothetical protein
MELPPAIIPGGNYFSKLTCRAGARTRLFIIIKNAPKQTRTLIFIISRNRYKKSLWLFTQVPGETWITINPESRRISSLKECAEKVYYEIEGLTTVTNPVPALRLEAYRAMKKLIFVFILFLFGCESKQITPSTFIIPQTQQVAIQQPTITSINTINSNEQCLFLCWMGINPGVTTFDEAKTILSTSDQIDQKWLDITNSEINAAIWYTETAHEITGNVGLTIENGVVKTITLGEPLFKMKNIINLIGEPDKISYLVLDTPDGPGKMLYYAVYFTPRKIMILSRGGWNGPDPDDLMIWIKINTEFNTTFLQKNVVFQPWRGYGHFKDYLPDVEIPPMYRTEQL